MGWNRSLQRSQPFSVYHPCGPQFRPDPLLHCGLKPSSRGGKGQLRGASPYMCLTVGGCQQLWRSSVVPSYFTWSLPDPLHPPLASASRFTLLPCGPGVAQYLVQGRVRSAVLSLGSEPWGVSTPVESAPQSQSSMTCDDRRHGAPCWFSTYLGLAAPFSPPYLLPASATF